MKMENPQLSKKELFQPDEHLTKRSTEQETGVEGANDSFTERCAMGYTKQRPVDSTLALSPKVSIHTSFQSQRGSYPCLAISSTTKTHSFCPTDCIFHNCNNNSNAGEGETSCSLDDPPKKKSKTPAATAFYKSNIEATLEGKSLWDEFCRRGTEMIVNRAGRRMFPGFSVAISSLKPKAKYSMKLGVVLADNHRFKFLNSRWLAVGSAEPQPLSESYLHPDSPNSGAFWMRHGVSFRKLKITNNKERPGNNALLYSMHKYSLRLIVEEERKLLPGDEKSSSRVVLCTDFPETTFVAVTAYQNEEVTQLKITNNPFAKAFRENAADMDWETAQMMYNNQTTFSPLPQLQSEHITNGCWSFPSSLVPPTSLTTSPLSSFITPNTPCSVGYLPSVPQFPYTSGIQPVTSSNYFQWPPFYHSTSQTRDLLPPNPSMYCKVGLPEMSNSIYSPSSVGANLPDFETVFTTISN